MIIDAIFGSISDAPILHDLQKQILPIEMVSNHFLSAHRNPEPLRSLLSKAQTDIFIAGAGLAAHLPGVIASQTIKSVIGLPINNTLAGLDSLLSILQMPFGVPVLTAGVDGTQAIATFLHNLAANRPKGLRVVASNQTAHHPSWQREFERMGQLAATWHVPLQLNTCPHPDFFNLIGVSYEQDLNLINDHPKCPLVCVPILDSDKAAAPASALTLWSWTKRGGLWVGVNNLRNGFLTYVQVINRDHLWDEPLWTIRRRLA